MRIHVTENFDQIARQLAGMGGNVFERAAASAMNKTVAKAKTAMKREIRAEFNIPASTVEKSLRIRRASFRSGTVNLEAALESPTQNGRAMNVIHFGARQTKKGVSVRIRKAGGRSVISHAFIANGGRTACAAKSNKWFAPNSRLNSNAPPNTSPPAINFTVPFQP